MGLVVSSCIVRTNGTPFINPILAECAPSSAYMFAPRDCSPTLQLCRSSAFDPSGHPLSAEHRDVARRMVSRACQDVAPLCASSEASAPLQLLEALVVRGDASASVEIVGVSGIEIQQLLHVDASIGTSDLVRCARIVSLLATETHSRCH